MSSRVNRTTLGTIADYLRRTAGRTDWADQVEAAAEELRCWPDIWANAQSVLHEAADDRNYCSEADDVFEEAGFDRRTKDWQVNVGVQLPVSVTVTASTEDDAIASVDLEEVVQAVYNMSAYSLRDILGVYGSGGYDADDALPL